MAEGIRGSNGQLITCWYEYAETLWNQHQVELLLVDVPRLKGPVTNSPGEDAVLAVEVINRRCLGFKLWIHFFRTGHADRERDLVCWLYSFLSLDIFFLRSSFAHTILHSLSFCSTPSFFISHDLIITPFTTYVGDPTQKLYNQSL